MTLRGRPESLIRFDIDHDDARWLNGWMIVHRRDGAGSPEAMAAANRIQKEILRAIRAADLLEKQKGRHAAQETEAGNDDPDLRQQFGTSGVLPGFEDGQQGRIAT
jgi:hypothetical protein